MIASGGSYYKIANGCIDSAGLPVEYQQVEYIEPNPNNISQYLDTGVNPQVYPRVVAKMAITNTRDRDYWGNNLIAGSSYLANFSNDQLRYYRYGNTNGVSTGFTINENEIHELDVSKEIYVDGVLKYTSPNTYTYNSEQSNIYIFASYRATNPTAFLKSSYKLYNFKLYDGTILVRNFIPCYRISDNEIGMYDTINGVFYTNQGTGTFVKGPNVYNRYKIENVESIYHIRGTATSDFDFTLKYIDRNNNVTTVTEHAVIDGNGKWDISYSGKKIKELTGSFKENTTLTGIEFTENFDKATNIGAYANGAFYGCSNLVSARFKNALFNNITSCASLFQGCSLLQYVDLTEATMDKVTDCSRMFHSCTAIETINLGNAIFGIATNAAAMFYSCSSLVELNLDKCTFANIESTALFIIATNLKELYVPNTATLPITTTFQYPKLSYDSMLRIAGWIKDLTGQTTQTVTFRKETYDELTAEQKATLQNIIVTQKGWNLATA